jgi:hypothetical protein
MSRTYVAIWPVWVEHPMTELQAEAAEQLPWMLALARCRQIGKATYRLRPGREVPGSGGAALVLEATVPVEVVPRNTDAVTGEVDNIVAWGRTA